MVPMHTAAHAVFEVPREVKVALDTQHPNIIRTYQHGARVLRGYRDQVCLTASALLYIRIGSIPWPCRQSTDLKSHWLALLPASIPCLQ